MNINSYIFYFYSSFASPLCSTLRELGANANPKQCRHLVDEDRDLGLQTTPTKPTPRDDEEVDGFSHQNKTFNPLKDTHTLLFHTLSQSLTILAVHTPSHSLSQSSLPSSQIQDV